METLNGKRLLVLGGTVSTYDVVCHAKKMGVYVLVTDYLEHGVAKEIADEQCMVSTSDIEKLKELVKEKKIDGVFTGSSEVNIRFVRQLCEEMQLPFYATGEQLDICMDKKLFKEKCRESSIPVVEEYDIKSEEDLKLVQKFPVIVKPVDACSSKGISVCYNIPELKIAYEYAMNNSGKKSILVEQFIENQEEVCMYYTIQNGNVTLSAMTDRDLNFQQLGKAQQPNALIFPSKYIEVYYKNLHNQILDFAQKLHLQNGTMFIQSFIKDGQFTVFEMGYRLCGANEYIMVSRENQINSLDMYIRMALTGKFEGWDNLACDNAAFKNKYCVLIPLLKAGTIVNCKCMEKIRDMDEVIHVIQFYHEGDTVEESTMGSLNQSLARIYITAQNTEELIKAIKKVQGALSVIGVNDEELLLEGFHTEEFNWE